MRIALDDSYRELASERFADQDVTFFSGRQVTRDELSGPLSHAVAIGIRWPFPFRVDAECLDSLASVQFIHKSGTGVDGLDVPELTRRGILLANNAGVNADSVADHAVMLALVACRRAYWHMHSLREGRWEQEPVGGKAELLNGKTAGIIGMGSIGTQVAKRLSAFGMKVIAHQRNPGRSAGDFDDVEWTSLDDLLERADLVVPCVPLTSETDGMISKPELTRMKPSAILVNCSRGKIVDEVALTEALQSGEIAAAGVDVFATEPTPADNPLLKLENVVATPHVAGRAYEIQALQIESAVSSIEAFISGSLPPRLVNPEVLEDGVLRAAHLANASK